jgi:ABC-type cobalamin transport system ATPase subunit
MRVHGLTLNVTNRQAQSVWQLSNGAVVAPEVAQRVIADRSVVGVGDTLLDDRRLSQTFGYIEREEAAAS